MIELQRQKLGLPPMSMPGGTVNATGGIRGGQQSSAQSMGSVSRVGVLQGHSPVAIRHGAPQPAAAVAALQSEDLQMQTFIHRLQYRDDSQMITDSMSGPTVPTALSRRILHKQGVGYLDNTVAAIVSASADRFLATVLHQSLACRNKRLEGSVMAREATLFRKRHIEQYETDVRDRRRQRQQKEDEREKCHLKVIEAAEALSKKNGSSGSKDEGGGTTSKSKKKKKGTATAVDNINLNGNKGDTSKTNNKGIGANDDKGDDDDNDSYISLDEEEQHYQKYYRNNSTDEFVDDSSDDEEDRTLILSDISRPLRAWDFHLTGKIGVMGAMPPLNSGDTDNDEDNDEKNQRDNDVNLEQDGSTRDSSAVDGKGSVGVDVNRSNEDGLSSPSKRDNTSGISSGGGPTSLPNLKQ